MVREVFLALVFPEIEIERLAEKVMYVALEKSVAFTHEVVGQGGLEEASQMSGLQKKGAELRKETTDQNRALDGMIMVVTSAVQAAADDTYYTDWLDTANLEDLYLFRIPRLIPKLSEGQISALVAQSVAGYLHTASEPGRDTENTLLVSLIATGKPGEVRVKSGPVFRGPEAIREELEGHSLREMPNIPMYITLYQATDSLLAIPDPTNAIQKIEEAWQTKSPIEIVRTKEGSVHLVSAGDLFEQLYLYELVNPGVNIFAMINEHAHGLDEPMSPHPTPASVAKELAVELFPYLIEGAELLIYSSVNPLVLPKSRQKQKE